MLLLFVFGVFFVQFHLIKKTKTLHYVVTNIWFLPTGARQLQSWLCCQRLTKAHQYSSYRDIRNGFSSHFAVSAAARAFVVLISFGFVEGWDFSQCHCHLLELGCQRDEASSADWDPNGAAGLLSRKEGHLFVSFVFFLSTEVAQLVINCNLTWLCFSNVIIGVIYPRVVYCWGLYQFWVFFSLFCRFRNRFLRCWPVSSLFFLSPFSSMCFLIFFSVWFLLGTRTTILSVTWFFGGFFFTHVTVAFYLPRLTLQRQKEFYWV